MSSLMALEDGLRGRPEVIVEAAPGAAPTAEEAEEEEDGGGDADSPLPRACDAGALFAVLAFFAFCGDVATLPANDSTTCASLVFQS